MANVTFGGFRPWGSFSGGEGACPHPLVQEVASGYATALGVGDIIIPVSDGTVARAATSDNGKLLGCIIGLSKVVNGKRQPTNYVAASTTFSPTTIGSVNATLVEYIPLTGDFIMEVDADDGTTAATLADNIAMIGENADMTVGNADSTTGVSAYCLDISDHKTATANFRIVGIRGYNLETGMAASLLDYDPTLTRFKFLVTCNEGFLPPYTASGL